MSNIIKLRKNKKRNKTTPESLRASIKRLNRALERHNNTPDVGGLDLMVNVDYYNKHGRLPDYCGFGLSCRKIG